MAAGFTLDENKFLMRFVLDLLNLLEMERDAVSKELVDQRPLVFDRPPLLEDEQREEEVSNQ